MKACIVSSDVLQPRAIEARIDADPEDVVHHEVGVLQVADDAVAASR